MWMISRVGGGRGVPPARAPPWVPGVPGTTKTRAVCLSVGRGWWKGMPRSPAPHRRYRVSPARRKRGRFARRLGVVGGRGCHARPRPTVGTGCPRHDENEGGLPVGWAWLVEGDVPLARAPPWVPGVPGTTKTRVGRLSVGRGWWKGMPRSPAPHRGYRVSPARRKRGWFACRLGVVGGRGCHARPRPTVGTGCPRHDENEGGLPVGWAWLVEGGATLVRAPPWVPGVPGTTKTRAVCLSVGRGWWKGCPARPRPTMGTGCPRHDESGGGLPVGWA